MLFSRGVKTKQSREWGRAKVALVAEPREETLFGIMVPHAANFMNSFNLSKAKEEHRKYRSILEKNEIKVIDIRDAFLWGIRQENGELVEGEKLTRLRDKAYTSLTYEYDAEITALEREELETGKRRAIKEQEPETLASIIMLKPTIEIERNPLVLDPTSRYKSSFKLDPAHNSYFMRDPLLTTSVGIIVGNFSLGLRKRETENILFALEQLGLKPLLEIKEPGLLEGGDFIPCGDFCLQGIGLLSNWAGVSQALAKKAYGFKEIGIVRDEVGSMDEMHLDTYFNILNSKLCCLLETRISTPQEPWVEVYEPQGTPDDFSYVRSNTIKLTAYLEEKGFKIIPISVAEQRSFALNYLLLRENKIVAVDKAGDSFKEKMLANDVEVIFANFDELTGGYGGPHCSTQVIYRE